MSEYTDCTFFNPYNGKGGDFIRYSSKIGTKTEVGRLETFGSWLNSYIPQPLVLIRCGFYATQKGDEVRCDDCLVKISEWRTKRDPCLEHYKLNKRCRYVTRIGKLASRLLLSRSRNTSMECSGKWLDPSNRLSSFRGRENVFRQRSVTDMANAGLYYIGPDDRVKCAYCDIILKEWELCDIPIFEHYLWSPNCPFAHSFFQDIVRVLGDTSKNFEEAISEVDSFDNQVKISVKSNTNLEKDNQLKSFSKIEYARPKKYVVETDALPCYDEKLQEINSQIDAVSFMDFDRNLVEKFAMEHLRTTGKAFDSAQDLYLAITNNDVSEKSTEKTEEYEKIDNSTPETIVKTTDKLYCGKIYAEDNAQKTFHLEKQNDKEHMDERLCCKICLENPLQITFQPCGHLVTCKQCAQLVDACPVCRGKIGYSITTYLS